MNRRRSLWPTAHHFYAYFKIGVQYLNDGQGPSSLIKMRFGLEDVRESLNVSPEKAEVLGSRTTRL